MKGLVILGFWIGLFLSSSDFVLADENQNKVSHQEESNHQGESSQHVDEEMDNNESSSSESEMDHSNMDESEMDHSEMTNEEHQDSTTHNESNGGNVEGSHSEGGHGGEELEEQPANVKVLGTFGAINLSFILIGIWNKWFRRREVQ